MQRFVTIDTYAKMCGILRTSVYKRLKSGKLEYSPFCEMPAIDIEEWPPNRLKGKTQPPPIKMDLPEWCYE